MSKLPENMIPEPNKIAAQMNVPMQNAIDEAQEQVDMHSKPTIGGRAKIGRKGGNHPEKTEGFILTDGYDRDPEDNFNFVVKDELEAKLKDNNGHIMKLNILLLFDDVATNLHEYRAYHRGEKALCSRHSNNAKIPATINMKDGTKQSRPCNWECEFRKNGMCKPHGILSFGFLDDLRLGAPWVFKTTGYHSIAGIRADLENIKATVGFLAGLRCVLKFQHRFVKQGDNTRKIPVVSVELAAHGYDNLVIQLEQAKHFRSLTNAEKRLELAEMMQESLAMIEDETQ